MMHHATFWTLGLVLVGSLGMGGCLLPQPDTPVIPPWAPAAGATSAKAPAATAPAQAPAATSGEGLISNNSGGLISNNAGGQSSDSSGGLIAGESPGRAGAAPATAPALAPAPATLEGEITGMAVTRVVAVPDTEGLVPQGTDVSVQGRFTLTLPPGDYYVEVTTSQGDTLRVGQIVTLRAGETRAIKLTLQETPPKATLTEEASLAAPSPSPQASPTVTPSKQPVGN